MRCQVIGAVGTTPDIFIHTYALALVGETYEKNTEDDNTG